MPEPVRGVERYLARGFQLRLLAVILGLQTLGGLMTAFYFNFLNPSSLPSLG